jgi:hypothetical protein
MADLSIAQLKALLAKKEKEADLRNNEEFLAVVKELEACAREQVEETEFTYDDVVRAMAENCGIAVKQKKGKKGVSTGITRASGNRKVNAYMLLLNEERRKLKLTGRKEPKEMTTNKNGKPAKKFLVDVSEGIWEYLKSTGLTSNSAVFQVDYQDWDKANPTENCTPYFAKWWNECEDKEGYDVSTDWETYYKGVDACVVDESEAEVDAPKKKKKEKKKKKKVKAEVLGHTTEVYADQNADTDCDITGEESENDEPEESTQDGSSDYSE